jgi:hypothetical protein
MYLNLHNQNAVILNISEFTDVLPLQHKPQDIINISHLNLKNVLRWTQMRLMKLIQAGLHKQKKCVDNASPAMSPYRRLVRWIYHWLGNRNRKVLPSCLIKATTDQFPSQQYCGFRYPN